jgi:hypothetical protein
MQETWQNSLIKPTEQNKNTADGSDIGQAFWFQRQKAKTHERKIYI